MTEWKTLAAVPNHRYGDASLSKLIRIAIALGYSVEDVEVAMMFDDAGELWYTIEVDPDDLFVHDPLVIETTTPTPTTQPALPPAPVKANSVEIAEAVVDALPASRTCPLCTRSFETISLMRGHYLDLHVGDEIERFQCEKCPKMWDNHKALAMHVGKDHVQEITQGQAVVESWSHTTPMLGCRDCNFYCATGDALTRHTLAAHNRTPAKAERVPLDKAARASRLATAS